MTPTISNDALKVAMTLFFVYYFFLKPNMHSQSSQKLEYIAKLGMDSDSKVMQTIIFLVPFIYALREDLGLSSFFKNLGITDSSAVVNL